MISETSIITSKSKKQIIFDVMNFINKHNGFFSIAFTLVILLLSTIIKSAIYIYRCGEFDYFNINRQYINVSSENIIYDLIFSCCIAIVLLIFNIMPYLIIVSNDSKLKKTIKLLASFLFTFISFIVYFIFFIAPKLNELTKNDFIEIAQYSLYFSLVMLIAALYFGLMKLKIYSKTAKKKIKNKNKPIIEFFVCLFFISLYFLMLYNMGKSQAISKYEFKVLDDSNIIIFEDKERFLVSQCLINEKTLYIYTSIQKEIDKSAIQTQLKTFEKVIVK